MNSDIRFEVDPDKEDYRSAAMHNVWSQSAAVYLFMGSAFGVGAGTVGGLQQGLFYGIVMGAIAPVTHLVTQVSAASSRAKVSDALATTSFVLSDNSITIGTSGNVALSKWADWHRAFETERVVALLPLSGLVQVIPKRQLSADVIGEVRALLRRALGPRAKLRGET